MTKIEPTAEKLQEVEIRALLYNSQVNAVQKTLLQQYSPISESTEEITDTYFCPVSAQSLEDIPMSEVGQFSLRLRTSKIGDVTQPTVLNAKVITKRNDHSAWDELETIVKESDKMRGILSVMGLKPFCTIQKNRRTYIYSNFLAAFDAFNNFGTVLELETMAPKIEVDTAKANLQNIMQGLGIATAQYIEKTATYEIMKKNAIF